MTALEQRLSLAQRRFMQRVRRAGRYLVPPREMATARILERYGLIVIADQVAREK